MDLSTVVWDLSFPVEGRCVGWELWIFEFTIGIKLVLESLSVDRKLVVSPDSLEVGIALFILLVLVGDPEIIDTLNSHSLVLGMILLWHLNELRCRLSWGL